MTSAPQPLAWCSCGSLRSPGKDLISQLEILLNEGQITFASDLLLAKTIRRELESFQAKLSETGRARFEAAGSGHDDWVSAAALAVYEPPQLMAFSLGRGGSVGGRDFHWEGDTVVYEDNAGWLPITAETARGLPDDAKGQVRCPGCDLCVLINPDVLSALRNDWFGHFDPYCASPFEYQLTA